MTITWAGLRSTTKGWRRSSSNGEPSLPEGGVAPPAASACQVVSEFQMGAVVFRLEGQIDVVTAHDVGVSLAGAVGEAAVVFDLTGVSAVDVAGMSALGDVIHRIYDEGGRIAVICPSRIAKFVRGFVGTLGFVFLAKTTWGALAWLAQPALFGVTEFSEADIERVAPDPPESTGQSVRVVDVA